MPDLEISNLPALAEAGVAANDPLAIADVSASETKKVTVKDLIEAGVALIDAGSIPSAKVAALGTNQVATGSIIDGAVSNVKLEYSTISLGGISLALGGTDATPAFNLADATGYPTSSLVGTITNAQLAGSIVNSKLSNSSVSFGGISLALGGTDPTPAFDLTDATGYKTTNLVGTITNAQLAGSIDVSKLVGSNVGFGGVTVALGQADATPAFNLTDATGYPTSALVGTITNAQLAGSIANAKLANSSVSFGGVSVALGALDATPAFDLTDATNYPASSLTGTITNAQLAGSIAVAKLVSSSVSLGGVSVTLGTADATPAFDLQDATGYPTSSLVGTITNAQLAGSILATKLVSGSITSTQLGANSVTDSQLANNAVDTAAVQNAAITNDKVETSTNSSTGLDGATKLRDGTITAAKLNTSNIDRSLNVASGNLGINNAVSGGASSKNGIVYNAQGLITSVTDLVAGDLPKATTSAVGGVSVGSGLSVDGAGVLSVSNSVSANSTGATKVTYNAQGAITGSASLVAADLPTATTSAKGAVQITSGGGLTVDGSGNLATSSSGVSADTYQSVTVNAKGVVTAGTGLTASLVPNISATKLTSGTIDAARIGKSIDGSKLTNSSTAIFQSVQQTGSYPTAQFNGQLLFDTVSEDCFIWDGNAWQAITTLTKGSLVFGGTYNANTSKMVATTTAGIAAGLAVGSNLPTASATTDGVYVVVSTSGTPASPAPAVAFAPPDYILGVTNSAGSSWNEVDLSQTVAGQVASNITFTPYGQISSTNVQDAIQELETEKLAKSGGEITGVLLIGSAGSLVFEGTNADAFETTLTVAQPTTSDKTITLPNITGTVITTGDTGTVTGTMLANDTIQNVDIKSDAAIAFTKLADLTSAQILVGNASNEPTAVAVTGDISINNAGLTSIASGVIVDGDISSSAAITGTKVAQGTTSARGTLQLTNAADSTSATTAATANAVKITKDVADAALPKDGSSLMTGHLQVDNDKELRLFEADSNGSAYIGIKGATDKGSEASYTISLPAAAPATGQVLKAGSTATTLEWAAAATGAADLTGNTLASGVTASSLTSVGTLTGLTVSGDISFGSSLLWDVSASSLIFNDNQKAIFGTGGDGLEIFHSGNHSRIKDVGTGNLIINASRFQVNSADDTEVQLSAVENGAVSLYHNGTTKFSTTATGATLAGTLVADGLTVDTDTLFVDASNNRVGIGTITPATTLEVVGGDPILTIRDTESNEAFANATLRLAESSSSNTLDQYWDIKKDASLLKIMEGDATPGATSYTERIRLSSSYLDLMGNVALRINTLTEGAPDADDLTISGAGNVGVTIRSTDSGNNALMFSDGTTGSAEFAGFMQYLHSSDDLMLGTASTERMRIDSSGRLLVGHNASIGGSTLQVNTTGSAAGEFNSWNNGADPSYVYLRKSRGGSAGTYTIVQDGDGLGAINFAGADGADMANGARILASVDGTPGSNDMPTRLTFLTSADGTENLTERMRITSGGDCLIGATSGTHRLTVQESSDTEIARFLGANSADLKFRNSTSNDFLIYTGTSDRLLFGTNGQNVALTLDTNQNATFAGTVSDSKGDLRKIIQNTQGSAYELLAADAGKHILASGNITWVDSRHAAGDAITIVNNTAGNITITKGTTMYNAADGTNANRTLATRGMATILWTSGTVAYISGAGLT